VAASFRATDKNFRRIMGWKDPWQVKAILKREKSPRPIRSSHNMIPSVAQPPTEGDALTRREKEPHVRMESPRIFFSRNALSFYSQNGYSLIAFNGQALVKEGVSHGSMIVRLYGNRSLGAPFAPELFRQTLGADAHRFLCDERLKRKQD